MVIEYVSVEGETVPMPRASELTETGRNKTLITMTLTVLTKIALPGALLSDGVEWTIPVPNIALRNTTRALC